MVFVPPIETIGDSKALYATLEELLEYFEPDFFTSIESNRIKKHHREVSSLGRTAAFHEKNRIYNRRLLEYITSVVHSSDLSDLFSHLGFRSVIFHTGVSPDNTKYGFGKPKKYGLDPFANMHAITSLMLNSALKNPDPYEGVLFFPVAPILWPYSFKEGKFVHAFKEIAIEVSNEMIERGKRGYGILEKSLTSDEGEVSWAFSPNIFSFQDMWQDVKRNPGEFQERFIRTNSIDEMKKEISTETAYNTLLMTSAYTAIATALHQKEIVHYSLKGSYSLKIMEGVARKMGVPFVIVGGEGGPLSKSKTTAFAEADLSCIGALNGYLAAKFANRTGIAINSSRKNRDNNQGKNKSKNQGKNQGLDYKDCPYEPFIKCSHQSKCDENKNPCAMDHFRTLDAITQDLVRKDTREHYYGIYEGVEAIIADLQLLDFPVFNIQGMNSSWEFERKDVRPLILPNQKFNLDHNPFADLRASALGGKCALSIIIGLYADRLPIKFPENDLSLIGTAVHSIILDQYEVDAVSREFAPNRIWTKLGKEIVFRDEFTEKAVMYSYKGRTISGHVDCPVIITDCDGQESIGVIDVKRSRKIAYPKWDHRYQLLTYGLAIRQQLKTDPPFIYLILVNRPFLEDVQLRQTVHEGLFKLQEITIMKVDAHNDLLLGKLEEHLDTALLNRDRLLVDNAYIFEQKRKKEECAECDSCKHYLPDQRAYCDYITEHVLEFRNLGDMLGL